MMDVHGASGSRSDHQQNDDERDCKTRAVREARHDA
jgi:hypothetical protein